MGDGDGSGGEKQKPVIVRNVPKRVLTTGWETLKAAKIL